ncbi:putative histone lysine methyltransferase, SET [Besnoitia besnoiti]|uniref:Putative histone lysine methyltransferase, SET n=1 Tax=Besnoitia besnoiti TaxID=94643 RepID=A0A2A9MEY9_BESBE|nr:putative histone lysine methyltransferase, SET [Besnoitia besnoiti]PFH36449.1 putative histone lysine methyltransferase, SET [Besnoitia besnoiti]
MREYEALQRVSGGESGDCLQPAQPGDPQTEQEGETSSPFSFVEIAFVNPHVGRGLVARRAFKAGEVIYDDATPLVAVQHEYSRRCSWACGWCFAFLGNLREQLEQILSNDFSGAVARDATLRTGLQLLSDDFLRREGLCLARPIPCDRRCGVVYCSELHKRRAQTESFHRLLCLEASPRTARAWQAFAAHSRRSHENFLLAGRAYAQILVDVLCGRKSVKDALEPFQLFHSQRWEDLADETFVPPETRAKEGSHVPLASREGRRRLLSESFALLCRVFLSRDVLGESPWADARGDGDPETEGGSAVINEPWSALFSLDVYSHLLGAFDLVNVNIEFDNPLNAVLAESPRLVAFAPCVRLFRLAKRVASCADADEIDSAELQENGEAPLERLAKSFLQDAPLTAAERRELAALARDLLPPFMGIGLFRAVSMTNHSCYPNAEVKALRDIAEGEQILQSYIDERLPLHQRQAALKRHYRFTCSCSRCRVEAVVALLAKRGALPAEETRLVHVVALATGLLPATVAEIRAFGASVSDSSDPDDDDFSESEASEDGGDEPGEPARNLLRDGGEAGGPEARGTWSSPESGAAPPSLDGERAGTRGVASQELALARGVGGEKY